MKRGLHRPAGLAERARGPADGTRRRDALRGAFGAIAAVAIVSFAPRRALAASDKVSKASMQYTETGNVAGKDCDDCTQFLPGKSVKDTGTCKIVEGDISPHGHCLAFTPKPKG